MSEPIPSDWRNRIRDLIRRIDPGAPSQLYIVDAADVSEFYRLDGCRGCTCPVQSLDFLSVLRSRGEWRGPAPCMLLDVSKFTDLSSLLDVGLHEYVHILQVWSLHNRVKILAANLTQEDIASQGPTPEKPHTVNRSQQVPWEDHAMDFARLACHLSWRAHRAGFDIEAEQIYRSHFYGLTSAFQCYCLLDDTGELAGLASLPLFEVAKIDPPERYRDFAARCLKEALAHRTEKGSNRENQRRIAASNAHDAESAERGNTGAH
jgi:hypothetical protein